METGSTANIVKRHETICTSTADLAACFGSDLILEQIPTFYAAEKQVTSSTA